MSASKGKYSFATTLLPGAIQLSLVQQAVVAVLGSLILDGGNLLRACLYAIAAYWIGFALIWFRRGVAVTKTDVFLVRWGFLILCVASLFLTGFIWRLRGHDVFS
jgi:hypothetical protein